MVIVNQKFQILINLVMKNFLQQEIGIRLSLKEHILTLKEITQMDITLNQKIVNH